MNILHICNAYQTNVLYQRLFEKVGEHGDSQFVIAPGYDKEGFQLVDGINVYYFKRSDGLIRRLLWSKKISDITRYSQESVSIGEIDVTHAHTLFSDGAVAYNLWKQYKIPYIVAVRGTDIFDYLRLKVVYKNLGRKIIESASKVVFISPSNIYEFKIRIGEVFFETIKEKVEIIPNGIDRYWLTHRNRKTGHFNNKIVFVGDFNHNKNIEGSLKAIKQLRTEGINLKFHAVGLKSNEESPMINRLKEEARRNVFFTIEQKQPKEKIREVYSQYDILLVPSFQETFGLVYIEALSQGLPVIWSRGQGIDGMYRDGDIGYSVNPEDSYDIAEKIRSVIENYDRITDNVDSLSLGHFDWTQIANHYSDIYRKV